MNEAVALNLILKHEYIRKQIKIQAVSSSKRNKELEEADFLRDIETNLYLNIKQEFKPTLDQRKIISWLCSRITWRTRDYLRKEIELEYTPSSSNGKKGSYARLNQISLESIADLASMDNDGEKPLEFYIRKSKIDTETKTVLIFRYILGYKLREIGDIYNVSIHKARSMCVNSISIFKDYLKFQGIEKLDDFLVKLNDL